MFHFDFDAINFLKIFVYLSDVCELSGPHEFMPKSHKPYPFPLTLSNLKAYGGYPDNLIRNLFDCDAKKLVGSKGTVIIEDTSGFHKGNILNNGFSRDILTFTAVDSII